MNKVMLLIDADNVSADVIGQAVERVHAEHGAIHVRRAYCTAESAQKNLALFKRHSIRPIVNLSAGKNSTDIALAVDALDLVLAERPALVVIVSSDSDFAPLVIRLREKGCRVEGIGQDGKTGDETIAVYDAFSVLSHRKAGAAKAAKGAKGAKAEPRAARAEKAPPKAEKAEKADKPDKPARPARTPKAAKAPPAPPPAPALPDEVERLLNALPSLRDGSELELRKAVEFLRVADLLPKNAPSTKLFRKHPDYFVLVPEEQPNKVRFIGRPG